MSPSDYWSTWFNSDRPWAGPGDDETVERISSLYGSICRSSFKVAHAQCRDEQSMETFDPSANDFLPSDQVFRQACTTRGLECVNNDQASNSQGQTMCPDYSVRFYCQYNDGDDSNNWLPDFDVRIYIILAVVPIMIVLLRILWACFCQRRRQQRQRGHRMSTDTTIDSQDQGYNYSMDSELANEPPSYLDIFGQASQGRTSSVFVITAGNVPVCTKCKRQPCSVAQAVNCIRNKSGSDLSAGHTAGARRVRHYSTSSCLSCGSVQFTSSAFVSQSESATTDSSPDIEMKTITYPSEIDHPVIGGSENSTVPNQSVIETAEASEPNTVITLSPSENPLPVATLTPPSMKHPNQRLPSSPTLESFLPLSSHGSPVHLPPVSQPCPCDCHRTVAFKGRRDSCFYNEGFIHDDMSVSPGAASSVAGASLGSGMSVAGASLGSGIPSISQRLSGPGMHRVLSSISIQSILSNGSVITMSELPSYEAALELMRMKDSRADSAPSS